MDVYSLIGGIIGIVVGIVGIIKGIIEIRKQLQEDKNLSSLFVTRKFRVALGLLLIGIVFVIGVGVWNSNNKEYKEFDVIVQVWDVEMNLKNKIIASNEFKGTTNNDLPKSTIEDISQWLTETLLKRYNLSDVKLYVHVPVDWEKDKLQINTTPDSDFKVYYWIIYKSERRVLGKDRIPLIIESDTNEPVDNYG